MQLKFPLLITALAVTALVAPAQLVEVLPTDFVAPTSSSTGWRVSTSTGGGSAAVTTTAPRSGDGSLQFGGSSGTSKAEVTFYQNPTYFMGFLFTGAQSLGKVGDLSYLAFDWMRSGAATAPQATPSLKLLVKSGGTTRTIVWEGAYNGINQTNHPDDTWFTSEIVASSASLNVANFWQTNQSNGPFNLKLGTNYSTWDILGITIGFGSGWNGTTSIFVDNVSIGFNNADPTIYDFDLTHTPVAPPAPSVPEPSTYGLIGAVLLGALIWRRRMRRA